MFSRERLPDQARSSGAERTAQRQLALSCERAFELQPADVETRNEQHTADGDRQHEERCPVLVEGLLGQRDQLHAGQLRDGVLNRHAWTQPRKGVDAGAGGAAGETAARERTAPRQPSFDIAPRERTVESLGITPTTVTARWLMFRVVPTTSAACRVCSRA
jgi:hypothetical protein